MSKVQSSEYSILENESLIIELGKLLRIKKIK